MMRVALLESFSRPTRGQLVAFAVSALCILGIAFVGLWPDWWRMGFLGEWFTYVIVAFLFLTWRPLRTALRGSSGLQRTAGLALLFGLVLGQFIGGGRHVFPLVRFQMFTDPGSSDIRVFHFLGDSEDGRTVLIDPDRYFPSLDRGRFGSGNRRLLQAALKNGAESKSGRTYTKWLLAILNRYNSSGGKLHSLSVYGVEEPSAELPRREIAVDTRQVWSISR